MSWLCEEAAKRYFASYGLRPKLVLCTGEGAMFSPEDVISDLLNNNEEVSLRSTDEQIRTFSEVALDN